jgi:hypothetical protein
MALEIRGNQIITAPSSMKTMPLWRCHAPKPHGAPRLVIPTAVILKINHVIDPDQVAAGLCPLVSGLE